MRVPAVQTCDRSFKASVFSRSLGRIWSVIRSSTSCSTPRMIRHRRRRDFWGVFVTFISHFREKKGVPLWSIIQARSSALRDGIGRGIEGMTGSPSFVFHGNLWEILGRNTRKKEGRGSPPEKSSSDRWRLRATRDIELSRDRSESP